MWISNRHEQIDRQIDRQWKVWAAFMPWLTHDTEIIETSEGVHMWIIPSSHVMAMRADLSRESGGIFTSTGSAMTSGPGCHSEPYNNTTTLCWRWNARLLLLSDRCQDRNAISMLSLCSKKPVCSDVQHNWPSLLWVTFPLTSKIPALTSNSTRALKIRGTLIMYPGMFNHL